ncbi:MAG: ATP-binding protein, partial [Sphingomonadaceae bacterium]|nr:ATP-binding protein [Sphingomonadaceae bacterium]
AAIADIARDADPQASAAVLYQDLLLRCRMRGVTVAIDMAAFRRRLALARAGIDDESEWTDAISLAASLPEEMLPPFLALARAARDGADCPTDATLAALYGTGSLGRARRMLGFIEEKGLIVQRTDLSGKRSISLPHLGWTTAAAVADPDKPAPPPRLSSREARALASRR